MCNSFNAHVATMITYDEELAVYDFLNKSNKGHILVHGTTIIAMFLFPSGRIATGAAQHTHVALRKKSAYTKCYRTDCDNLLQWKTVKNGIVTYVPYKFRFETQKLIRCDNPDPAYCMQMQFETSTNHNIDDIGCNDGRQTLCEVHCV